MKQDICFFRCRKFFSYDVRCSANIIIWNCFRIMQTDIYMIKGAKGIIDAYLSAPHIIYIKSMGKNYSGNRCRGKKQTSYISS